MLDDLTIALNKRTAHIIAARFTLENERHRNMSRLSEKLKQAGGVAGRLQAKAEARADEVIAREPVITERIEDVFAGHFQHLEDAEKALDALERDLALMGNEPTKSSGDSQEAAWERQAIEDRTNRPALGPHPDQPAAGFAGIVDADKIRDQVNKSAAQDIAEVAEVPAPTFRAAE